jgi:hypothetical protein
LNLLPSHPEISRGEGIPAFLTVATPVIALAFNLPAVGRMTFGLALFLR